MGVYIRPYFQEIMGFIVASASRAQATMRWLHGFLLRTTPLQRSRKTYLGILSTKIWTFHESNFWGSLGSLLGKRVPHAENQANEGYAAQRRGANL
jgi:hypothetical protein